MSADPLSLPQLLQLSGPLLRAVFTGVRHRGQLALLETEEARDHFLVSLAVGGLVLLLALVTLFTGTIAIAAAVWDLPNRAVLLAGLAGAYLAGALTGAWWVVRRLRAWRPLDESRRQLRADGDWIEGLLPSPSDR